MNDVFLKRCGCVLVKGKTTNGLMRHLRENHGISISGSKSKKDLLNMGYYHGYKGYRFIGNSQNRIPYTKFEEVVSVYHFDTNLKSILYPNIMLIETAIKNYTLDTLIGIGPADFDYVFSHLLNDYKKHNIGNKDYREKMKKRLDLRNKINEAISYNYSENKAVIQHFFHKNKQVVGAHVKCRFASQRQWRERCCVSHATSLRTGTSLSVHDSHCG